MDSIFRTLLNPLQDRSIIKLWDKSYVALGHQLQKSCRQRVAPRNLKPKETNSSSADRFLGVESTIMTLEDHLVLSPALNPHQGIRGGEISVLKQPNNRIYPTSLDADDTHFYMARWSVSSSGKLEKIDEVGDDEKQVSRTSILCRNWGRSMKKKVSSKLPEEDEHVIIFYSTEETFD